MLRFDIHSLNNYGYTAVHLAAKAGHAEVVSYLISKGADVNISNMAMGRSPLHGTCNFGNIEVEFTSIHCDFKILDIILMQQI